MKNSKTKKILSILLALVMLVGMIPTVAVAASGTLTWGAEANGEPYVQWDADDFTYGASLWVKISKDGNQLTGDDGAFSVRNTGKLDLTQQIRNGGSGEYVVEISEEGKTLTSAPKSFNFDKQLDKPTLSYNEEIVTLSWNDVGAAYYLLTIYKDSWQLVFQNYRVDGTSIDLSEWIPSAGSYSVTLKAISEDFTCSSSEDALTTINKDSTLPEITGLKVNGLTASWNAVDGATYYYIRVIKVDGNQVEGVESPGTSFDLNGAVAHKWGGEGTYRIDVTAFKNSVQISNEASVNFDFEFEDLLAFDDQSPEMPSGETTTWLEYVVDESAQFIFNNYPLVYYWQSAGYGVEKYARLEGLLGDLMTPVEKTTDVTNAYPCGINHTFDKPGMYKLTETLRLKDKDGNTVATKTHTFNISVSDPWVRNIDVSATSSGTPADATTSTTGAEVTETKWYKQNGSSWTALTSSDTIKEGYTYRCEVTVAATDGYTLADGYTVKINGIAATKKSGNTWYRDVTITGISDYVEVNDIDLPEAYTNPDFTYDTSDVAPSRKHWDVAKVEWFECDKDGHKLSGALTENDVFKKDTYYRIEVTVVPETNWQFHGSQLSVYINGKAAMPIYGYNKAYPDSVTGFVVYNTADIEGDYELFVYDDSLSGSAKNIYIKDGQYLGSDATVPSDTEPSGGYAYYKDGVLELNGYDNEKAHFIFEELALELYLVGDNTIGAIYDNEFGMAGGNLETRQGNLVIDAADGGKLTIASNPLDAFANIQVKDLYFNGGELTSCLANGTYGAAVQLNGGNLYLENGYEAYVSDTNDIASATKWDRTTDISDYDCVWIVEKPKTILNVNLSSYLGESDFITLALYDKNMDIPYYHYTLRGNTTSYSFPAVPYGEYVIVAEKPGHVPYQCKVTAEADSLYQDIELQLYADTNLDGEIDENDYQALVNTVLADDHEQIETAEYDDLIQYDLVMDGYLDVLDAAVMALVVNGHKTIDEVYDLKKGDYDYDGEAYTESDLIAMYHVLSDIDSSAPTLSTSQKFASDLNYNGKVDEGDLAILTGRYGTIEATTCEENIKVYYRWGNSYTTCTATAICTICDKHVAKETVNSVKNADGSYTATFTNTLLGTKTFKKQ